MLSRFVALFFLFQAVQAFFSINYAADESHPMLMTSPGIFKEAPQAEHVADIYARLSGNPPIFWEGMQCNLCLPVEKYPQRIKTLFCTYLIPSLSSPSGVSTD